jgi:choline dehydrogenase-like flavoprotein
VIHDLRKLPEDAELQADVCVVGAGPVGIAVAAALADGHADVLLLEGGGLEPDEAPPPRGVARAAGLPYPLQETRVRAVGGTAHAWNLELPSGEMGALMRPLEPIDFVEREWVPGSGWPIDLPALLPYYARAYEFAGLPPTALDRDRWLDEEPQPLPLDPARLRSVPLHYASRERFTLAAAGALPALERVQVWHHADVVELETDASGRRVVGAVIRCADDGTEVTARANVFVLAGGGAENARLLLASTTSSAAGIGNRHDLVGRCFMEHPQGATGVFVPRSADVVAQLSSYAMHQRHGTAVRWHLYLSEEILRAERLLGYYAALWPTEADWLADDLRDLALRAQQAFGAAAPLYAVSFQVEQAPNPDSRVTVARDASGDTAIVLDWRLTPLEYRTLVRAQQIIQEEFHLRGLGTVFTKPYADDTGGFETGTWRTYDFPITGAHHHMGTTRMHEDPRRGVVDADCKVHDVDNLYVVGASVFPTSSHVNPTLTATALGVRLGEHLHGLEALARPASHAAQLPGGAT